MARRKVIRLTKELKAFICEKIASGTDLATVCKKYSDKLPTESTVRKAQTKDLEFYEAITRAYDSFFQMKLCELEQLSTQATPEELLSDRNRILDYQTNKRLRIDTLKFLLGKMAPMFSKRWEYQSGKKDGSGDTTEIGTQIVIQNYAEPSEPKLVEGVTYDENPKNNT